METFAADRQRGAVDRRDEKFLRSTGRVMQGDTIVLLMGAQIYQQGTINLKIVRITQEFRILGNMGSLVQRQRSD